MDKKYKILIVDDEPDNLALLYRTLRRDYEVVKSNSPMEAIEILNNTNDFSLILSDHKMPEIDGVEFMKRTNHLCPNAARVLVTAYSDAKILIDAINQAKIYRYVKKPYTPDELLHVVRTCLEYHQLKVDNENLITDFKELFGGTIKAIIEALDAKDSYTSGRSRRVTFYSSKIAQALHLPKSDIGKIELAGLLHDIGMIGVAEDILNKSEKLTDEEFDEIKKHVYHSVKILEDIKQLNDVIELIKYHHEHFDGNGYPYKLKGDEIPIGSRIIAITDAFDGIVSNRAYRPALTNDQAIAMLEEKSGTQFDAELLNLFKRILPEAHKELLEYEKALEALVAEGAND